jgi:leucyl-tRNA synthetase
VVARDCGTEGGILEWPAAEACAADDVARELAAAAHAAIRKVGEDIDPRFQFNTAIAALMELVNTGTKLVAGSGDVLAGDGVPQVRRDAARCLAQAAVSLTQPFAPHVASELWTVLGGDAVWAQPWPVHDDAYLVQDSVVLAVQVNGKLRGQVEVAVDADEASIVAAARADAKVAAALEGMQAVKEIVVPGRLVNLVVRPA